MRLIAAFLARAYLAPIEDWGPIDASDWPCQKTAFDFQPDLAIPRLRNRASPRFIVPVLE